MFTGYFAKLKEYKQTGLIPISISAKAPDWYDFLNAIGCDQKRVVFVIVQLVHFNISLRKNLQTEILFLLVQYI